MWALVRCSSYRACYLWIAWYLPCNSDASHIRDICVYLALFVSLSWHRLTLLQVFYLVLVAPIEEQIWCESWGHKGGSCVIRLLAICKEPDWPVICRWEKDVSNVLSHWIWTCVGAISECHLPPPTSCPCPNILVTLTLFGISHTGCKSLISMPKFKSIRGYLRRTKVLYLFTWRSGSLKSVITVSLLGEHRESHQSSLFVTATSI